MPKPEKRWEISKAIFKWKNLISRTWLNHWSYCPHEWKVEKAAYQYVPICALTCQHGPTLKFVSCAEKDSLCETVMIHDGLIQSHRSRKHAFAQRVQRRCLTWHLCKYEVKLGITEVPCFHASPAAFFFTSFPPVSKSGGSSLFNNYGLDTSRFH